MRGERRRKEEKKGKGREIRKWRNGGMPMGKGDRCEVKVEGRRVWTGRGRVWV